MRTAKPPFDQIVGRACLHRPAIDRTVVIAREHDDRRAAAPGHGLTEQIKPRARSQMIVEETQIMAALEQSLDGRLIGGNPLDANCFPVNINEDRMRQEVIILVVVDNKNVQWRLAHVRMSHLPPTSGNSTISIQ